MKSDKASQLASALEHMIVTFKEVDDRCASLTEDLTTRELNLVSFVGGQSKVIMREIADFLNIPLSTATGIVDKLVTKKYLTRKHSEKDRRIVQIELTERGICAHELLTSLRVDMASRIMSLLSSDETKDLIVLLDKITIGLNQTVEAC